MAVVVSNVDHDHTDLVENDGSDKNENESLQYFSRCGFLSKQIVAEEKYFIKFMDERWKSLSQVHKDDLLDLLFVDDKIRKFNFKNVADDDNINVKHSDENVDNVQNSFPRLFINSGQKINVDFENDLWTWRDEHSGPFSWMSRSQQDLTLADLDEENISKPQPKLPKIDVEAENQQKAPEQFTQLGNSWSADIIEGYKKKEPQIRLSPKTSYVEKIKNKHCLEEVNPAFNESCEHLPITSQPMAKNTVNTSSAVLVHKIENSVKLPLKKPKKRGSLNKSSGNGALVGSMLLSKEDAEASDAHSGFTNVVMESEWSTFVGAKNAQAAPESMVMDRSEVRETDSPYKGDNVCLIQASPPSAQQVAVLSPAHSEWSEESTPDHTTYLLKGMQSPQHHKKISHPIEDLSRGRREEVVPSANAEEILKVELKGDTIIVTTENQFTSDADMPTTGFDFLDNW